MHETQIADNIVRIVTEEMGKYPGQTCTAVHVRIGQWVAVVPDLLTFAFDRLIKDSHWPDARLEMTILPIIARCNACSRQFEISELTDDCPNCHHNDLSVIQGKELYIDNLEVDTCPS